MSLKTRGREKREEQITKREINNRATAELESGHQSIEEGSCCCKVFTFGITKEYIFIQFSPGSQFEVRLGYFITALNHKGHQHCCWTALCRVKLTSMLRL